MQSYKTVEASDIFKLFTFFDWRFNWPEQRSPSMGIHQISKSSSSRFSLHGGRECAKCVNIHFQSPSHGAGCRWFQERWGWDAWAAKFTRVSSHPWSNYSGLLFSFYFLFKIKKKISQNKKDQYTYNAIYSIVMQKVLTIIIWGLKSRPCSWRLSSISFSRALTWSKM